MARRLGGGAMLGRGARGAIRIADKVVKFEEVPMVAVFLDTMLFQQYRFPDEIDWPRLVGAPEVELVIAPVVMRQLNRHKDASTNPRLRERAARALTRLGALFANGPAAQLRPGVTLRYVTREPQLDFAEHALARDIDDDHLLASVLAFRQACAWSCVTFMALPRRA